MSRCPGTRAGANVPGQIPLSRPVPGQNDSKISFGYPVIAPHCVLKSNLRWHFKSQRYWLIVSPKVSTTPLRQCLLFSWTTLRGSPWQHPIGVMFELYVVFINYQNVTSNIGSIVSLSSGGLKCPHKIYLKTRHPIPHQQLISFSCQRSRKTFLLSIVGK